MKDDRTPLERALDYPTWNLVSQSIMGRACARNERTEAELLLIARSMMQDLYDMPDDVAHAMGWAAELEEATNADIDPPSGEEWCLEKLTTCSAVDLARFMAAMAISSAPIQTGDEGRDEKLALAQMYGVGVLEVANSAKALPLNDDDEDQTDDAESAQSNAPQADLLDS